MNINNLLKECNELCEALKMKKLAKFTPGRKQASKDSNITKWNIELDGKLVGRLERSKDTEWDDSNSWRVWIYEPGTKTVVAQYGSRSYPSDYVSGADDPNEAFKKLAMGSKTRKSTIKAIQAHGVEVKNLNKKHFKPVKKQIFFTKIDFSRNQ